MRTKTQTKWVLWNVRNISYLRSRGDTPNSKLKFTSNLFIAKMEDNLTNIKRLLREVTRSHTGHSWRIVSITVAIQTTISINHKP